MNFVILFVVNLLLWLGGLLAWRLEVNQDEPQLVSMMSDLKSTFFILAMLGTIVMLFLLRPKSNNNRSL
ncbi:MAG: hypothetical protein QG607_13 [Patescibacteria group bacterium]|jgi:hypothetical protein|nr:hypothetical protein [Patescibacteria group bacterium]